MAVLELFSSASPPDGGPVEDVEEEEEHREDNEEGEVGYLTHNHHYYLCKGVRWTTPKL